VTSPLLELQAADTMAEQLRHRRETLAEREQVQATKNALLRWNEARMVVRRRIDELTAEIEETERASAAVQKQRERMQAQLRTIIAPREAEALQHELATLQTRRGDLDEAELIAMDEQTRLEAELEGLLAQEESLTADYLAAEGALSAAETDIDGELKRIDDRLAGLRAGVDKAVLRRYDGLRKHFTVAAATLAGSRCDGCHLDLSAMEIDELREAAAKADGIAECPQCGRLLVL